MMGGFLCVNGVWNCETADVQRLASPGKIPLAVSIEGYKEYAAQYGASQTHQRLQERGGFACDELAILLYDRCQRLSSLEKDNAALRKEVERLKGIAEEAIAGAEDTAAMPVDEWAAGMREQLSGASEQSGPKAD
jgi:hypothetical protein